MNQTAPTSKAAKAVELEDIMLTVPFNGDLMLSLTDELDKRGYVIVSKEEFAKSSSSEGSVTEQTLEMPWWKKFTLTIKQASEYFGIGISTLRELTESEDCSFVLKVGTKRLIKRVAFEEYLTKAYSVASCGSALK